MNGERTAATLFETDDRMSLMGFELTDFGCCKVIGSKLWGHHAFVGVLFFSAPEEEARKILA